MSCGSSMLAMIFSCPPQRVQRSISTPNSGSFYSYMFVNDKNQLGLFESAALPASISYMLAGHLSHIPPGTNQSYADPRIEAPQYINTSHISFAPVWEQYKYGAYISPSMPTQQSLIFWNNIPN
jgi:hypothetical protein